MKTPRPGLTLDLAAFESAMREALALAAPLAGRTTPNPNVGAVLLAEDGRVLGRGAHLQAGEPHAEILAIEDARRQGELENARAIVVTLEPCTHFGRTPPCAEAILGLPQIQTVAYGARDPKNGGEVLAGAGLQVHAGVLGPECEEHHRAWLWKARTGHPWITVKVAKIADSGSLIPPPGKKTFAQAPSLKLAHELRRRADALLTGSGTVLADSPEFTVRHVPDHPGKQRILGILDARARVPDSYLDQAQARGFQASRFPSINAAFHFLAEAPVLEVLIEAGPTLLQTIEAQSLWNEWVEIEVQAPDRGPDRVTVKRNSQPAWPERDRSGIDRL